MHPESENKLKHQVLVMWRGTLQCSQKETWKVKENKIESYDKNFIDKFDSHNRNLTLSHHIYL